MSEEEKPEPFDLEQVYDDEIAPLMAQILEVCQKHRMPMVASFQYKLDEVGEAEHCSSGLAYKERGPSPMIKRMTVLLTGIKQPGMKISVVDKDGRVVRQEVILDPLPGV